MITNHFSHRLSDLDLLMASFVPPGGNWKNIPSHVPSSRLAQIRESYAAGEGSRSTYYGRLKPDRPSYTINTYFNRPGNGCFLHYDFEQHRTISQREAARLQSFPDSFKFVGSKISINKQIGNAVPPLLSFQLATEFVEVGSYVDLFSGAGGLSLGFHWAGWRQVVANDIEKSFLETYTLNLGGTVVLGDIAHAPVFNELLEKAKDVSRNGPFIILGGPPCQGFSTAGKRRSMDDNRNHLFKQYAQFLSILNADGFIFENVPGLLNMNQGSVFHEIRKTLEDCGYSLKTWILRAEEFGVPQRRTRIFVVGQRGNVVRATAPLTSAHEGERTSRLSHRVWSVEEALEDLPPLLAGQDGSQCEYREPPNNAYQDFLRGNLDVKALVKIHHQPAAA